MLTCTQMTDLRKLETKLRRYSVKQLLVIVNC